MGLDHTITLRNKLPKLNYTVGQPIYINYDNEALVEAFHHTQQAEYYMRKVNCVQGYFERKYDVENCQNVVITLDDIEEIQKHAQHIHETKDLEYAQEHLPITGGFFYGNYEYNEWYFEDIETIATDFAGLLETAKRLPDTIPVYWCWY